MKSPSTSCSLDPMPTWLLKNCLDELLPVITKMINMSIQSGQFPDVLKSAQITHRKEMSLPHTPAADLPQICSRPAADSHLFHMQISFAADLPQYDEESAAGLLQTCCRPAAYPFSMMKESAADLPQTLHHEYSYLI